MKDKRKGVAILSAMITMSVVILLSTLIISLVISFSLMSRHSEAHIHKSALMLSAKQDFIDNGVMDDSYDYYFLIVTSEDNPSQKALICSKSSHIALSNIYFYIIYDFDSHKILAQQSEDIWVESREVGGQTAHYLAGIVRFEGGIA